MGVGSENLIKENYGLPQAFSLYYANNKTKVINAEDLYFYENYYLKIENVLRNKEFYLKDFSPYIKGMIYSYTVRKVNNNILSQTINDTFTTDILSAYKESNGDENTFINNLYKIMIDKLASNETEKQKLYKERGDCLDKKDDSYVGTVGERLVIDNIVYNDNYVKEDYKKNTDLYDNFIDGGKFYEEDQKEWYSNVRKNVDYDEELNIRSGYLDVAYQSSNGIKQGTYIKKVEDELVLKEIDNGQNIIYIPQNATTKDYSNKEFCKSNVGQSGGSLSCLSMAINKLLSKKDEFLVTPDKVLEKIGEEKGNSNYYYNEEKEGVENELITDVCDFYGLSGSIIAQNSLYDTLYSGSLVIARVSNCEFTTAGNFILLSGIENVENVNATYVIDPNIAHASYLYNLYTLDYIKSVSDVLFKISK